MKKSNKKDGVSKSNNASWRIVGDAVIRGDVTNVTYTMQDVLEISLEKLPGNSGKKKASTVLSEYILEGNPPQEQLDLIYSMYPSLKPEA